MNKDIFNYKLGCFGHNSIHSIPKLNGKIESTMPILKKRIAGMENNFFNDLKTEDLIIVKRNTREFFNANNIILHNVPMLKKVEVQSYLSSSQFSTKTDLQKVLQGLFDITNSTSPLDLPNELIEGHSMIGRNVEFVAFNNFGVVHDPIYCQIQLGKQLSSISSAALAHEISHTQLEDIRGVIKNHENAELLPIFIEKLYAYQIDNTHNIFRQQENWRIKHLYEGISANKNSKNLPITTKENSFGELCGSYGYIVSTFKAYKLFDIYLKSSVDIKREIIADINNIFNGEITLEEILSKYQINNTNMIDRKLIEEPLL